MDDKPALPLLQRGREKEHVSPRSMESHCDQGRNYAVEVGHEQRSEQQNPQWNENGEYNQIKGVRENRDHRKSVPK